MNLFSRKNREGNVASLILAYVKSQLPKGVIAFDGLTSSDKKSISISSRSSCLTFEFEFDEKLDLHELSEVDKDHLTRTIVIPALKQLDKELFDAHKEIEKKLKELRS